jgi:hypothetical protein
MRRIIAPLFAVVLLLGVAALVHADTIKYVCDPITYPDNSEGIAVVRVIMSSGTEAAAPTVMVTVDYYSPGYRDHLGRYEDWSSSSNFPTNEYEAEEFAFDHFHDRW